MPPFRLAQFSMAREPVVLPSTGRTVPCRALSAEGYQVLAALGAVARGEPLDEPPSDAMIRAKIAEVIPEATDAERAALQPTEIMALLSYAAGKLDPVLQEIADEVAAQAGEPAASEGPSGNAKRPARTTTRRATTSSK